MYERVSAPIPLTGRYGIHLCKNSSCDDLKSFGFTTHCIPPLMGRCPLENGIYGLLKGSPVFEKVLVLVQNVYVCLIIGGELPEHSIQNPPRLSCSWRGAHPRNVGLSIPPAQCRSVIISAHLFSKDSRTRRANSRPRQDGSSANPCT